MNFSFHSFKLVSWDLKDHKRLGGSCGLSQASTKYIIAVKIVKIKENTILILIIGFHKGLMFFKILNIISAWLGYRTEKTRDIGLPINHRKYSHRFILPNSSNASIEQNEGNKNVQKTPQKRAQSILEKTNYELIGESEQQQYSYETQQFIEQMKKIEIYEKKMIKQLQKVTLNWEDSDKNTVILKNMREQIDKIEHVCRLSQGPNVYQQEYNDYQQVIVKTILARYPQEIKTKYRHISFQEYKKVTRSIWNGEKKGVVDGYQHLKYQDLKLMRYGEWLNDQLITDYLKILMLTSQKSSIILDSLQTTSIFEKSNPEKIRKILTRKSIHLPNQPATDKQDTTKYIYMVIHKVNHWIFMRLDVSAQKVIVYDSLKTNLDTYLKFRTIKNVLGFFDQYYRGVGYSMTGGNSDLFEYVKVQVCQGYPQQNNGYDCGMMALCGIRNLIKNEQQWSFSQREMKYRRVCMTLQLLQNKVKN